MSDDIIKYYNSRFLDAVLFSHAPRKYFSEELVSKEIIKQLEEKVIDLHAQGAFIEKVRYNLLELINFLRYENEDFGIKHCDDINGLIKLINDTPSDNFLFVCYLFNELYIRIGDANERLLKAIDIYKFIQFDLKVLESLICSDEDFEKMLLNDDCENRLYLNQLYFFSINKFLYDIPELFNNKQALKRVLTVLEINAKYKKCSSQDDTINLNHKYLKNFKRNNRIIQKKLMK